MSSNHSKISKTSDIFDARKTKETHNLKPHPITGRLIDNHPGKRIRPMRVLALGLSRTGTMSLYAALEQLGYKPYHMAKAIQAPKSNLTVWKEGLNAKFYGIGKVWGREEFDKVLGEYDAVADVPCATFAEELMAAYPEAKVILQNRDVDKWLESMNGTAGTVLNWPFWSQLAPWDQQLTTPFWDFAQVVMPTTYHTFSDFSPDSPAREAFRKHYEMMRRVCPKERLLEYEVKQHWKPLCEFLEVPVPEEPFPHVNDKRQFLVAHAVMWYLALGKMVFKVSVVAVPVVAVGVAVWQRRIPDFVRIVVPFMS